LAEQQNGGLAPKAAPASTGKSSSKSSNDLARIKMLASQHMSASQIASQLGKSVSAVIQEAAAAGINLSAGSTSASSSSTSSTSTTGKRATGNNVNKTA
jgi:hypothetical protein